MNASIHLCNGTGGSYICGKIRGVAVTIENRITRLEVAFEHSQTDMADIKAEIRSVREDTSDLRVMLARIPTKNELITYFGIAITVILTAAAIALSSFSTGGGFIGIFADRVLDQKEHDRQIDGKLDRLLSEQNRAAEQVQAVRGKR